MILSELALQIVRDPESFKYEDLVEAYQFINDNGITNKLDPIQLCLLQDLIESGQVFAPTYIING